MINIFGDGDALKRHTDYIHINADNIMDLLNTQNQHNAQIMKITEYLLPMNGHKYNRKLFSCGICNKTFQLKGLDLKCKQCDECFEGLTSLQIHKFRFHGASL